MERKLFPFDFHYYVYSSLSRNDNAAYVEYLEARSVLMHVQNTHKHTSHHCKDTLMYQKQ